ncbi:MAG: [FeFe] hydrogenase H-cluster radical SAM maturase HydG [bacterium]|nr:[FeFe] hydrogenase H-cluster radical SAM maturase HydG [bacterium]
MNTSFIDERRITEVLQEARPPQNTRLRDILERAETLSGLGLVDTADLLMATGEDRLQIMEAAGRIKRKVYGDRVVIFAPLYLHNECINNCLYCSFRQDNEKAVRRNLTPQEAVDEARALAARGHRRLLLVCGEHPRLSSAACIAETAQAIYAGADIRRLHVNAAPLSVDDFRTLQEAGIGVFQVFQETYHRKTYAAMHPSGRKADYNWRVTAMDRAMAAGIGDVGMGVLFGLYDHKFEILALLQHSAHLRETFGVGAHTVSVPRLRPAAGAILQRAPYPVDDEQFQLVVAVLRLALPYAGIVLTTREAPGMRDELLAAGVSQISAGSSTSPGGYLDKDREIAAVDQFKVYDNRSLKKVLKAVCNKGYIPSFCTACYRKERTGAGFYHIAGRGELEKLCLPNALLTFKEYLQAENGQLKEQGEEIIHKALNDINDKHMRKQVKDRLARIEQGERDILF